MIRSLCIVIGLGSLAAAPALPDVVNVSVNGLASGSGVATAECAGPDDENPPPGCVRTVPGGPYYEVLSFNFNDPNNQLGPVGAYGNATGILGATLVGATNQGTTATADALEISLYGAFSCDATLYCAVNQQDTVAVTFDLTTESQIQLAGNVFQGTASNSGELLDSMGNVILDIPVTGGSESTILAPGVYQLDASVSGSGLGPVTDGIEQDLSSDLNANFTPVPEPRWAILAALLCIVLGRFRKAVVACEQ